MTSRRRDAPAGVGGAGGLGLLERAVGAARAARAVLGGHPGPARRRGVARVRGLEAPAGARLEAALGALGAVAVAVHPPGAAVADAVHPELLGGAALAGAVAPQRRLHARHRGGGRAPRGVAVVNLGALGEALALVHEREDAGAALGVAARRAAVRVLDLHAGRDAVVVVGHVARAALGAALDGGLAAALEAREALGAVAVAVAVARAERALGLGVAAGDALVDQVLRAAGGEGRGAEGQREERDVAEGRHGAERVSVEEMVW